MSCSKPNIGYCLPQGNQQVKNQIRVVYGCLHQDAIADIVPGDGELII